MQPSIALKVSTVVSVTNDNKICKNLHKSLDNGQIIVLFFHLQFLRITKSTNFYGFLRAVSLACCLFVTCFEVQNVKRLSNAIWRHCRLRLVFYIVNWLKTICLLMHCYLAACGCATRRKSRFSTTETREKRATSTFLRFSFTFGFRYFCCLCSRTLKTFFNFTFYCNEYKLWNKMRKEGNQRERREKNRLQLVRSRYLYSLLHRFVYLKNDQRNEVEKVHFFCCCFSLFFSFRFFCLTLLRCILTWNRTRCKQSKWQCNFRFVSVSLNHLTPI